MPLSRRLLALMMICAAPFGVRAAESQPELLVFAAASMTNVLQELTSAFEKSSGTRLKLSFAASSALAKQIEAGAKADVFVSADQEWMDYLATRKLIDAASRRDLVGNQLVLIAPADSKTMLRIERGFALGKALNGGRLAVGEPEAVPAGRYARDALTALGVWTEVADHLASGDSVRTAMTYVERGEAPLGIVYTTDALVSSKVRVVGTFPADTHKPITYPIAAISTAGSAAKAYLTFLDSAEARAAFRKYGFTELKR